jgi:site-specific DNA-methyltransferase (adenine-specific)
MQNNNKKYKLICGDSIEELKQFPDNHFDSIVTDPPYELGFMGKSWDSTGIAYNEELWSQCFRVLKPGGHLIAFSGSRTYHRMAVAIENSKFEIRDQIIWMYGQGFPKSLDISKAIDKKFGAEREVIGKGNIRGSNGVFDGNNNAGKYGFKCGEEVNITAPSTEEAKQWDGWGTALKPAHEPMVLARKPLSEKTVAENVLKWGVGGLNIDGCRVEFKDEKDNAGTKVGFKIENCDNNKSQKWGMKDINEFKKSDKNGRFPANIIHDGSEEVVSVFPNSKGKGHVPKSTINSNSIFGTNKIENQEEKYFEDSGSASRFFYCAKASKKDRNSGELSNNHPTVKPTDLMAYLCRLVTPPNGLILDPFNGSGSTCKAAVRENFNYVGIDLSQEYLDISKARIDNEINNKKK